MLLVIDKAWKVICGLKFPAKDSFGNLKVVLCVLPVKTNLATLRPLHFVV